MTDEVQFAFSVEEDLRASFIEAAKLERRPEDHVLRELMRLYVDQVNQRHGVEPIIPTAASAEQRRRAKAAAFATASVALEGLHTTPEVEALTREFIEGNLTIDDAMRAIHVRGGER